jgi:hypothetical protein
MIAGWIEAAGGWGHSQNYAVVKPCRNPGTTFFIEHQVMKRMGKVAI